jgi:hypothetical protein
MKEFVLLFRMDITTIEAQPTEEQMNIYMQQWMQWINYISEKGQLAGGGNHLIPDGRVLSPNNIITKGPYISNRESVAGYIIILADNIDDAVRIAQKCPILQGEGTSVEVREAATPATIKKTNRTTGH